jgi:hypothetical protein
MKFTNNPDKKKNVYDSVGRAGGENAGTRKPFPADAEEPKVPTTQTTAQQQSAPAQVQQPQTQSPIQVDDIVDRIMNRENFSFDLNEDAIYQQYADQYARMGQMAMMDTMGQAQAMTGGYGNSYAQTVGQQSYQNYMQGLNEAIPDLYQMALDRYMMEGDMLMDQYGVLADREAIAEEQRRYDQEWAAAHPESSGRGGGGGSGTNTGNPGGNPQTQNPTAPQIGEVTDTQTVFDGSTYSQAVEYMEANGVSSAEASGVMTESEWNRRKNSYQKYGTGGAEVTNYDSYKEYLADYVEYKVSTSGGTGGSDGKKGGNGGR